jgi:putative ABC transport system permease protein
VIVPRRLRSDWQQEWEAELQHREVMLEEWNRLDFKSKLDLLKRSLGAFWDALMLQPRRLEDEMYQDIRFGLRMMLKNKGLTAVAVITLALGIGANTAIFSVVNAVLLQPLPYPNAHELTFIQRTPGGDVTWPFSPAAYLNMKSRVTSFTDTAVLSNKGWPANLTGRGEPERLQGYQVSANLFNLLGVYPAQGRTFLAEEDRPGSNHVVVISHEFWQRKFNGDPEIIGQSLTLNGSGYDIIGVMPANFRYYDETDLWTPLAFTAKEETDGSNFLVVIARIKPGVLTEQATAETDSILREFINDPNSQIHTVLTTPQSLLTQEVRPMLLVLIAAVGFVLLIACANVANLLLAHAKARRKELAIRSALGAGRFRVMRQLLVESTMLALLGAAGGLLLANWLVQFVASGLPEYLGRANSRVATLHIDTIALGFTLALSLLTSIIFGMVPAIQLSKVDLNESLKEGGRNTGLRNRFGSMLVVAEVALAMVLLVGAGLMIKSFWRLTNINPGYEASGLLSANIDPSGVRYEKFEQVTAFYTQLLERVSAIPGVSNAAVINSLNASSEFTVDEHPPVTPENSPAAQMNQISPDYFKTMKIPLRAGREFTDRDTKKAPRVVIIDESLARRYFPDEDPIGKHINIWDESREIVGVVGAARYWSLEGDPFPHLYFPYLQENWWSMSLRVRSESGDPLNLTPAIRNELAAIDKDQPIHSFLALEEAVSDQVTPQRFITSLMTGFAALAGLLAVIGIYGVMSYSVNQRTREIGVRMALGAGRGAVMKAVMKQGMVLGASGITIGLFASIALTRLISGLLFGLEATDPATLIAITLLLLAVALVACFIPARRATKVDPIIALRVE